MTRKGIFSSSKYLALDLGGSKLLSAIVSVKDGESERRASLSGIAKSPLGKDAGRQGVWNAVLNAVDETLETSGVEWNDILAIGVTIPGVADPKRGYWVFAPFSGIKDFPIADELAARYAKPVFADNDVNACAWGERIFGVCQNVENFLWITISNGIGGGLVLNGRVYPGKYLGAAEIGHFNVVEDGAPCGCGGRGCLEATASGPGIARAYRKYVWDAVKKSSLLPTSIIDEWRLYLVEKYGKIDAEEALKLELESIESVDAALIADDARKGNPLALTTYREMGGYVGRAASWAANLINPEKIVIGGGVARAFDLFYPTLWEKFQKCVFRQANQSLTIEKTGLGYEAGLLGAASLAYDNPYSQS